MSPELACSINANATVKLALCFIDYEWVEINEVAKKSGISIRSMQRVVNELQSKGIIDRKESRLTNGWKRPTLVRVRGD